MMVYKISKERPLVEFDEYYCAYDVVGQKSTSGYFSKSIMDTQFYGLANSRSYLLLKQTLLLVIKCIQ